MTEARCSCVVELVVVAPGRSRMVVTELDPKCEYGAHRAAAQLAEDLDRDAEDQG